MTDRAEKQRAPDGSRKTLELAIRLTEVEAMLRILETSGVGRAIHFMPNEGHSRTTITKWYHDRISPIGMYEGEGETPQEIKTELIGYILPCSDDYKQHLIIFKNGTMIVIQNSLENRVHAYYNIVGPNNQPLVNEFRYDTYEGYIQSLIEFVPFAEIIASNFYPPSKEILDNAFKKAQEIGRKHAQENEGNMLESLLFLEAFLKNAAGSKKSKKK